MVKRKNRLFSGFYLNIRAFQIPKDIVWKLVHLKNSLEKLFFHGGSTQKWFPKRMKGMVISNVQLQSQNFLHF